MDSAWDVTLGELFRWPDVDQAEIRRVEFPL
jgi:hypothetical protein